MSFVIVPEAPVAHAVNVGLYELDGDVTNGPAPGVDAEDLRAGNSGAVATTVVSDPVNTGSDIMFQSGGGAFTAKDTGDVSQWRWTTKEPNDKLDLIDVLAAQYVDAASEDPFVYIGATRYDGSGASTLGFWFLQDPVELGTGGRFNSIETGNPATHVDGDVLIVADFGGTNQLDIYRWSGTGPVLESTTSLSCLAATATTPACGVSNPTVIPSPWPIEQKGHPSNQIGPDAFVELGLNLESTLGNDLGCYQSIVATSRTSDSITATLNDFALAGVSTCDISITKTGPWGAAAGDTVTYSFVISNDGITPLALDSVSDDVVGDLTTDAAAAGCDSLRGGESCSFSIDYTVPAGQAAGSLTNTVTAAYQPPNGRTTATATDSHTTQVYRPALTVTKTADLDPANVGDTVTYTYLITNTTDDPSGSAAPSMAITSVDDDLIGTIDPTSCGAVATGASCTLTATDVPDGAADPLVNEVEVSVAWGAITRSVTATESIDVNRAPSATDDDYSTDEDTPLTVAAPGILTNDPDPDGDTLSVQPVTDTIPGDLVVSVNGALTYDPAGAFDSLAAGESTAVSFDYTATDPRGLTSTARVEITITGVNDPIDANPDSYTVDEGQTLTVPAAGVLANDTDPDASDVLNVVGFDSTSTGGGTVAVAADGSFTYTPAGGFTGTDTFTYTVSDGSGSSVTETVTITVTPAPNVVIANATIVEGGDLVFDVSLSRAFSAAIDVTFATSDDSATVGDDYTATTVTVTFDPGDTSATVTVPTIDDSIDEPDETLTLSIASTSTPIGDTSDTGTGTILDDDAAPVVSISDASASEGDELTFTVTLSNPSSEAITVDLASTDAEAVAGSDYAAGPYSVTFAAGDTSGTLTVGSIEDTIDEPSETFTISVSSTTGGPVGDTSDTGTGTIVDDDEAPSVTIGDTSVTEGGDLSFAVSLSNPSSTAIVLTLTTTGVTATAGDDYDGSAVTVTFLPEETSATALVATFGDVIDETDETLSLGVAFVIGTVGDTTDTGTGTILDDDAAPDVVIGDVSVTEGGDLVFDVTLTNPSSGTITVGLATADGTATAGLDYSATTGTVTFVAGDVAATFMVPTTSDTIDEADETLTVSVSGSTGSVGDTSDTGTGTVTDDDSPPTVTISDATTSEGDDAGFTLTLSNPSAEDIAVEISPSPGTAGVDDLDLSPILVIIPAGSTSGAFDVPTTEDTIDEPDEQFTVSVTSVVAGTVGDSSDTGTGTIVDDDAAPGVLIGDVSVTEGGDLVFDVTLTGPSSNTIIVDLATADGTATSGSDYPETTGTVTFTPGDTAGTFTVATTDDLLDEPDETLTVSVTGSTGTVGDTSDTGTGTIVDDDDAPDVTISDASAYEGDAITVTVTLSNPSSTDITVTIGTADDTATAGSDYTAGPYTVTFPAGTTTATFDIPTVDDVFDEADETIDLSVVSTAGTVGDTSDTAVATILDNDAPPTVTINDVSATEAGDLVFTVSLSSPAASTVTLDVTSSDGTATAGADYTATTETLTFLAGDTDLTFTVPTLADATDEPDETMTVSVSASTGPVGDASDTGTGTILDDDGAPAVLVDAVSITEGGDLVFAVTLSNPSSADIIVELNTTDGTATAGDDYTATTTQVTFSAGDTAATFTVATTSDVLDEPDETLTVVIAPVSGTVGDTSDTGTGTIIDDDATPSVVIGDASIGEGGDLVFDAALTSTSAETVTVTVATSDATATAGDDYTATSVTVTFAPGETVGSVTVPTAADTLAETDETLTVSVAGSTGTLADTTDTGTGTITDDDTPDVTISDATIEEGGDLSFTVELANPSSVATVITLSTSDGTATAGSDYTATTTQVNIPAGDTSTTFTVPTLEDTTDEPDETLTVAVEAVDAGIVGDSTDTGTGTIVDDDAAPAVVINDVSVSEGGDLVFDVILTSPASGAITVDLTTSDGTATAGSDYTATTGTVTFVAGDVAETFTVPTTDDLVDEVDETLTVSVTGSTGSVGDTSDTGTGTIVDDEGTPAVVIGDASITEGGDLVFDVSLSGASGSVITLDLSTTDGTATAGDDYTAVATTLVFTPGTTSTTVTVPTTVDVIDEPDETLTLAVTAGTGTVGDTSDTGTGTILDDDDAPDVTIGDASAQEGTVITVTVTLSNPSSTDITVTIGTADDTATAGTDYTAGPYLVTFPAGSTTANFDIPTIDDGFNETDETIDLSVVSVTGTVGDTSDTGVATILDDDGPPTVTISDASATEGDDLVFDVTLSNPAVTPIALTLTTSDGSAVAGSDYTATALSITFASGETAATFSVPTIGDSSDEPDETTTVSVTSSTGPVGDTSDTGTGTILDDDAAPSVVIGDVSVTEGGDLVFDVNLTNPSTGTIAVDLATADATATAGTDYTATTGTITFNPGDTAATFTVPTVTDGLDEPDEILTVSVTSSTGPVGDLSDTGTGTITDDDATPDVAIDDVTIIEGGDLVFDVTLTAPSAETITVTVATSDGTATASDDYTATSVTVTFNPGDTAATVTVQTAADMVAEADETLTLAVTGSTGTVGDTTVTGIGTITDDDAPVLTISDATVTEGGDLEFTVEIATTSSVDTVVTLTTTDDKAVAGVDYTATTSQVMIPAGDTTATFTVSTLGDTIDEPDEALTVSVASVDSGFVADSSDTGTGTITDDDFPPSVTISDTSAIEGDGATFTATLSNPSAEDIVIQVTPTAGTATGSDFDQTPVTVTVQAGATSVTFDVPTIEDTVDEPDETFIVAITSVTSGTVGDTSDTGTGTIIDDDAAPTVSVSNATAAEGDDLTFTVSLSNGSATDVTVTVATSDGTAGSGTDYGAVTADVTIPAGATSATATVGTVDDAIAEPTEAMALTITGVVSGTVIDPTGEAGIGTISDDDAPAVSISDASAAEGDDVVFTVTSSNTSTTDTVLVLQPAGGTAGGGSDFDADPITVTIPAGDLSITVLVPTIEDGIAEPTEAFTLGVSSVTSGLVGDTGDTGTGTITDDDAPDVFIDDVTAAEGDALVFTVTLSNPTYETIEVVLTPSDVSATGGADYAAGSVTATFAPGDTSATATIAGIDDTTDEPDETFTLSVTSATGDLGDTSDIGTGTITDDDGAPSVTIGDASVTEGGDLGFPVTLSNPAATDMTIVISLADDTATGGDDYTAGTVSVTIPAGTTTGTAVVGTIDDAIDELTETLVAAVDSTSGGAVGDTSDTAVGSIVDDDAAPSVSIGDATEFEGDDLVFAVTLSNPSSEAITVSVGSTDGTATNGVDYTGGGFDVVFAAGETIGSVTVSSVEDTDVESDETFTMSVAGTAGGAVGSTSDSGTGTIVDDDVAATPNVSIGDASVTEGGDLVFPVTLDTPAIDTIQLEISTADGTATAGVDYTATTATVTITAGASSASFTVPTIDDTDLESTETMSAAIGSFSGSVVMADVTGTGTINDNDSVVPDVAIGDVTVSEGDTATFAVSLTAPAVDDVTITIETTDATATAGADYTSTTVAITILAGQSSATFDVPTIEDSIDEPDESFSVSITSTTGTLGDTSDTAAGTIADDDGAPAVIIEDASATEGDDLVFAVSLTNPSSQSITVTVGTTDGSATGGVDYTGGSFDVTFGPGDTSAFVTVSSTEDADVESNETFTLGVTSTTGGAVSDTSDAGTGTIVDDDSAPTPDVSISDAAVTEGGDLSFTVTLSVATTTDVTLTLATSNGTADGSDYTPTTAPVTIAAGDTSTTFTVPTTSDSIAEPDETVTVGVASVDAGSVGDISDTGIGTILDDDTDPIVTLDDVTVTEGGDAVIPITLSNPSSGEITITLGIVGGTADDSDRPDSTVTVTIPAGETSATATFQTTADTVDEPDETFIVAVGSVDAGTVGDVTDTATATILDDDGVLGSITGRVWDDFDSDVDIDPGEPVINGVTVELYRWGPDSTFGTSDDVLVDSTVTAGSYVFSDLGLGIHQVRVVVATLPSGYVATGDFDGGTDSASIATVIGAAPLTDVDFGYVVPNGRPVAVDDTVSTIGAVTIDVVSNDSDPDGDPLTVDSIVQPGDGTAVDNGDGTVTYSPDAGFSGTDDFTYTVCDPSGACDTATVTVTVDLAAGGGTPPALNNPPDYATGFVPEVSTIVGGGLGPLPVVDPDGDNVTVRVLSGTLPPGPTLNPDGSFSGTATTSGTFVLELELCDDAVTVACVVRPLTIVVDATAGTTPVPPPPPPEGPELETPAIEPPGPVELAELPFTGLETQELLALALILLGSGAVLLRVGRSEP